MTVHWLEVVVLVFALSHPLDEQHLGFYRQFIYAVTGRLPVEFERYPGGRPIPLTRWGNGLRTALLMVALGGLSLGIEEVVWAGPALVAFSWSDFGYTHAYRRVPGTGSALLLALVATVVSLHLSPALPSPGVASVAIVVAVVALYLSWFTVEARWRWPWWGRVEDATVAVAVGCVLLQTMVSVVYLGGGLVWMETVPGLGELATWWLRFIPI